MYVSLLSLHITISNKSHRVQIGTFLKHNDLWWSMVTDILKARWRTNLYYDHTYANFCGFVTNPQKFQDLSG